MLIRVLLMLLVATTVIAFLILKLGDLNLAIVVAIFYAIGAIIVAMYNYNANKKLEINARHFSEKKKAYSIIVDTIFDLFKKDAKAKARAEAQLVNKMQDFKKELLVWGSPKAIKAMEDFELGSYKKDVTDDPNKFLILMENLLRSIREDLGHDDRKLEPGAIIKMFIIAEEKDMVEKLFNKK